MKLIADITVDLPFTIDICAQGPNADPLICSIGGYQAILYFPPSLGEGTDGQGIYGDWAWWTGRSLRIVLERHLEVAEETDLLRAEALQTVNQILRRFLNAYRYRLNRPEAHPVQADFQRLSLEIIGEDGRREALPEPIASFLRKSQSALPPLDMSISAKTLALLQDDVQTGHEPPLLKQLEMDATLLETQGEFERAVWLRKKMTESGEI
jgi:hypothetical protein